MLLEMSELTRERTGQRRAAVAPRYPRSTEPSGLSSARVAERDVGDVAEMLPPSLGLHSLPVLCGTKTGIS